MGLRLWPQDFERKENISKAERFFLKNAEANFSSFSGHAVVGIDPLGLSTKEIRMGMFILQNHGVVTFSLFTDDFKSDNSDAIIAYVKMIEDRIYERLLDSKVLIAREGGMKVLKFPYKHVVMLANESVNTFKCSEEIRKKLEPYVTLRFITPITSHKKIANKNDLNLFGNIRKNFSKDFITLEELECRALFERLAPEYTVVLPEKEIISVPETIRTYNDEHYSISGKEMEYKTFFLDEYQVSQVNDMGKGHRVILANPGAGKSVLLLAKAFKYASIFKDKRVLLTCFNDNLSDSYLFKRSCANFGENQNLDIMTLNKLVKELLYRCMGINLGRRYASEEEIESCVDYIKKGKINVRYQAIFIDEVQIFEPIYLELCYLLLEKNTEALFLMAGDLNQTVRSQSKRGDAPWKRIGTESLDFTGRVKYIERNYRNSKQIGLKLNRMLKYMNSKMESINMVNLKEFEYNSFEMLEIDSLALQIQTGINRMDITRKTIDAIVEIHQKYKISFSDIAVLFPCQEHNKLNYYFLRWIKKFLDANGIDYSVITRDKETGEKTKYSNTKGVVLSTIDSSLGLDFKAVIVTGLYPYNYIFPNGEKKEIRTWEQIKKFSKDEKEMIQIQMRKLYTGCSRARDVLYVLSDLKPESPMEEIFKN